MFKNVISQTPFVTEEANDYFTNIVGETFQNDNTFVTTLRALLADRIGENESLFLSFYRSGGLSPSGLAEHPKTHIGYLDCWSSRENHISVYRFDSVNESDNEAWLQMIGEKFEGYYPGWHRVDKVTAFFRKVFHAECFINPELKSVIIFTDRIDVRKMHYLQCGIVAFLPWYFEGSEISADEMALIQSLREKESSAYEECIDRIASRYNFQEIRIRKLLNGFETRAERIRCDEVRNNISYLIRNINEMNERIGGLLSQKRDAEITLLGLETKIASDEGKDSEIQDYFLTNKTLSLKRTGDDYLEFVVKSPLVFYDEDMAERFLGNEHSVIYEACSSRAGGIPKEDMKLLMTEIFLKQTLKIQFCAAYRLNMRGNVTALTDYDYGAECAGYMPNPHIDRYSCMGDYQRVINELLMDHDYIGALEQCGASCRSLNFGDGTVMREFITRFVSGRRNNRCILLPTGKVVKPAEAISWLREQNEEVA